MTRWFERTLDPNSPAALDQRAQRLRSARRAPITDRVGYLRELARGRRVLDIGVVDHDAGNIARSSWLHRQIADVAAYCLGIDVLPEGVERLANEGFNVRLCDITRQVVDEKFEVVIAGEVIEHVGRPGDMFENVRRSLVEGGRFVLTSPNPFALHRVWRGSRGDARDSVDHVAYYSPANMAELADRTGFRLDAYRGVRLKRMKTAKGRVHAAVRSLLTRTVLADECECETIVYECVKTP